MLLAQANLLLVQTQLAQTQNDTGPEFGKASPFGLVVIVVLLIGTALLIRSMNGRLKKLPPSFDPTDPLPDQAVDDGTDRGAIDRPPT
ncbi:hypothetical protein ACNHUS_02480 [Actinomycetes bacterium M1A6_2h]